MTECKTKETYGIHTEKKVAFSKAVFQILVRLRDNDKKGKNRSTGFLKKKKKEEKLGYQNNLIEPYPTRFHYKILCTKKESFSSKLKKGLLNRILHSKRGGETK